MVMKSIWKVRLGNCGDSKNGSWRSGLWGWERDGTGTASCPEVSLASVEI